MSAASSTSTPAPSPILVVGMNRSGTKWLSNILCNHPDVFGAQLERHTGTLETNLFGKMQDLLGDLESVEHFIAFVELWAQTDFFKATGIEREFLYTRSERARSMLDAFRSVMSEAAIRADARFWLQKTSPIEAVEVLPWFPNARVVTIQRALVPTLESGSKLRRDRGEPDSLLKSAAVYGYEAKLIRRIQRQYGAVHVDYGSLRREPASQTQRICESIGLDFRPQMLEVPFAANTSFSGTPKRGERLASPRRDMVRAVEALVGALPLALLTALRKRMRRRRALLVTGTFAEIADRYRLR